MADAASAGCGATAIDIGNSWLLDAGEGYRFTPMLREDVTASYRADSN
jgi:hypothetical protein